MLLSMDISRGADLFPVASGVQVPFVGKGEILHFPSKEDFTSIQENKNSPNKYGAETLIKTSLITAPIGPKNGTAENAIEKIQELSQKQLGAVVDKSKKRIEKRYLKTVSEGLMFSEDVVANRGRYNQSSPDDSVIFKQTKKSKPSTGGIPGRHDARCPVVRHYPCYKTGQAIPSVDTLNDKKPKPLPDIKSSSRNESNHQLNKTDQEQISTKSKKKVLTWDEYLMTLLSKETAEMVIKEYTAGQQSLKLNNVLDRKYQKSKNNPDELSKAIIESSQPKGPVTEVKNKETMTDSQSKQDAVFLKEVVHGAMPVNSKKNKPNEIVLDSNDKVIFGKVLEKSYPSDVVHWFDWESKSKKISSHVTKLDKKVKKIRKGLQKWSDYPEILEDSDIHKMTLHDVTPARSLVELDPKVAKKQREDANLVRLVDEWRGKWFLEKKWENSSGEELLRGMNDINDHVRLSAVSACSKALLNKKIKEAKSKEKSLISQKEDRKEPDNVILAPGILEKIIELLTDKCKQVQVASAITLFALNRATQKAKEILIDVLADGGPPEKWAAAQCLAYADCDTDGVIQELISHVNSPDIVKHSKSVQLLAKLSKHSTNVLYMMAEQLNSSSWRDRVVACQVFPALQGPLRKDVANKISHLMWTDWSKDVRTAAARALGQTGNGKLVHDKLRERLMHGNEIEIMDALRKISHLGIMTGRLLPSFLKCLRSDYVSIRLEAVKTVAAIHLSHEEIVEELLRLVTEERSWKVKAHCLRSIGIVAKQTDKVQETLIWCLRYEREAAIRAEACRAICNLEFNTEEITAILQDRMVVEEDLMVKSEVASTLHSFGLQATGDLTMLEAVQKEVKRLCNRDNITSAIVNQDLKDKLAEKHNKYLTVDSEDGDANNSKKNSTASQVPSARGFDPILEGYRIRSQSQVSVPNFPHLESSVLELEANSDEEEVGHSGVNGEQSESGMNGEKSESGVNGEQSEYSGMEKQNEDSQTVYSHSTATYLFE